MVEPTWWLDKLLELVDKPRASNYIAEAMHVSRATLWRWARKDSQPSPHHMAQLIHLFSVSQELLQQLSTEDLREQLLQSLAEQRNEALCVPHSLYERVVELLIHPSPTSTLQSLWHIILEQAHEQLDPSGDCVALFITQCVPPVGSNKVRSLRVMASVGTTPWGRNGLQLAPIFLGSESTPGYVVLSGIPLKFENVEQTRALSIPGVGILSACTYPLRRGGSIAGTFGATSSRVRYFSEAREALVRQYAQLIASILPFDDFYTPQRIDLQPMPHPWLQIPYLDEARKQMLQRQQEEPNWQQPLATTAQEQHLWQALEEKVLQLMRTSNEPKVF